MASDEEHYEFHIDDMTWNFIKTEFNPDHRLRLALGRAIEHWKMDIESHFDYFQFMISEREIQSILRTVESLSGSLRRISNDAYGYLIHDRDQERILNQLGPDFDFRKHKNLHGYYHKEIIGGAIPFLTVLFKNAVETMSFREPTIMKKRNSIRDKAIPYIEEIFYVFTGNILQTGKYSSSIWLRPILNAIGCYTTDNSVEAAIRKWAKKRDSGDRKGVDYYSDRDSIIRKRVIFLHDKPVERLNRKAYTREDLI